MNIIIMMMMMMMMMIMILVVYLKLRTWAAVYVKNVRSFNIIWRLQKYITISISYMHYLSFYI